MSFDSFWLALQFLTRLPVPRQLQPSPLAVGSSVIMYPLVGLVIGGLLAGWGSILDNAPPSVSAAFILVFWVVITGGLHLDGLADSADAWVGGQGSSERTLEILKDTYSGSAAVIAIVLILLTKFAALAALQDVLKFKALLLAPVVGRTAILVLLLTTPYMRHKGLGSPLVEHLPHKLALVAIALVLIPVIIFLGTVTAVAVLAIVWLLRGLMLKRIGGCTGDTLGASVEITEVSVLVATLLVKS